MSSRAKTFALLLAGPLLLAACAGGGPYQTTAEVVRSGRDSVTVRAESWLDAQEAAERYCRRFRRSQLTIGRQPDGQDQASSFYEFDCITTVAD